MNAYELFREKASALAHLSGILATLAWDQEVMMPKGGIEQRARQRASLAALCHALLIGEELGNLLDEVAERFPLEARESACSELKRQRDRAVRLPGSLVREITETCSLAYEAWVEAKGASRFEVFAPWLEKVLRLKRQEAACLMEPGTATPYEVLLDEYEPGAQTDRISGIFSRVRPRLSDLLNRIRESEAGRSSVSRRGCYPIPAQLDFGRRILTAIGFDWSCGRLDVSPHPFCAGLSPHDVRLTTRFAEDDFAPGLFGMIHEAGHGLYEQGLPVDLYGLPSCEAISLGIHESQSRLWENFVGRSRPFWKYWLPHFKGAFPGQLDHLDLDQFLLGINRVEPSLIRVEADEVTYGLHVILRFELERSLMEEEVDVASLPEQWDSLMDEYLGVRPSNTGEGILQDTHWSQGLIGYFPTYLLGNLYAAQLIQQAYRELHDLDGLLAAGEFGELRDWLRAKVHLVGRRQQAEELIRSICEEDLNEGPFLDYLEQKYGRIYGLAAREL